MITSRHYVVGQGLQGWFSHVPNTLCGFLLLTLVVLGFSNDAFAKESDKKLILIIQSYHPGYSWVDENVQGIEDQLWHDYEIVTFYMDTKRLSATAFTRRAELAWKVYEALDPNLVMLGDDNALRLLAPKIASVDTPFVYFGINNNPRVYFDELPPNVTGVLERVMISRGIIYLSKIIPSIKKLLVIADGTPTSKAVLDDAFDGKTIKHVGVKMEYQHFTDWSVYQETIKNADQEYQALVLMNFFAFRDDRGKVVDFNQVATWTSANSPVPVFGFHEWVVRDDGIFGGYPLVGIEHGKLAAEMADEILKSGKLPSTMVPRTDRQGQLYLNKKQLERLGLKVPESIISDAIFK